jgi:hypothetical protein
MGQSFYIGSFLSSFSCYTKELLVFQAYLLLAAELRKFH